VRGCRMLVAVSGGPDVSPLTVGCMLAGGTHMTCTARGQSSTKPCHSVLCISVSQCAGVACVLLMPSVKASARCGAGAASALAAGGHSTWVASITIDLKVFLCR